MNRPQSVAALAVISATCAAGVLAAPWWAGLAGACLLALISLNLHRLEYARYARLADYTGQSSLFMSAALNASAAGAAAFLAGRAIGWYLGI